ncbi:hypothetical protein [Gordonia aurantiaca]|uniref:hypothetical protein n=1 Tax=Gordonia sp. B21 TaxID=3151852 RepID=UPI0032662338
MTNDAAGGTEEGLFGPASLSGGARTDWLTLGIDEIIDILHTMDPGSAQGDVNTILQAIDAVRRAAARLDGLFPDDGLRGLSADAAVQAGRDLAAAMQSTLATASVVGDMLGQAAGIVGSARGQEGRLQDLRRRLREKPEGAPQVRYEADELMGSTYSTPMQGVQRRLPVESTFPAAVVQGVGGMTGASSGGSSGDSTRGQAANAVDAGDFGRRTAPSVPATAPPVATAPGGAGPAPSGIVSSTPAGSSTSGGRGLGDDPDGLRRGARGLPERAGERAVSGDPRGTDGHGTHGAGHAGAGAGGTPEFVTPMPMAPPWSSPGAASASATPSVPGPRAIAPSAGPLGATPIGRRSGNDDERHKTAPYLHNREHGAEIVGALPLVGPPVVGDWTPHAPAVPPSQHPAPATSEPAPEQHVPSGTTGRSAERVESRTEPGGEGVANERRGNT